LDVFFDFEGCFAESKEIEEGLQTCAFKTRVKGGIRIEPNCESFIGVMLNDTRRKLDSTGPNLEI